MESSKLEERFVYAQVQVDIATAVLAEISQPVPAEDTIPYLDRYWADMAIGYRTLAHEALMKLKSLAEKVSE